MPHMISLRKFRLPSLSGHVLMFEANTPRFVPDAAVAEAMQAGCVPVDPQGIPLPDDYTKTKVEFRGDLRRSILHMVMARMVRDNDTKNFDAGGVPKLEVLARVLGFEVDPKERKRVWQAFLTGQANGEEVPLHPDAQKVLDIVDADSKADLKLLASDMGIPDDEVSGLSARDLRQTLLARFSGLTNVA